jgi:uncharacterized membrane protein YoaK (UPF0700 family)
MKENNSATDVKMISLNEISKENKDSSMMTLTKYEKSKKLISAPLPMNLNTRREFLFVSFCGCFLTFNSGYLNGCSLTGYKGLSNINVPVAGLTGTYTKAAIAIADHNGVGFVDAFAIIGCFIFGSFLSGLFLPKAKPMSISPEYGPLLLLQGLFLTSACIGSELNYEGIWLWYLLSIANGIQNGITSIYSGNMIRTTHLTGTSTDIGLIIGQIFRGNYVNSFKLILLLSLTISFCLGATLSITMVEIYGFHAIIPNTILVLIIGILLIIFVSNEFNITFWEALSNSGGWDQAIHDLKLKGKNESEIDLIFNDIDVDKSETIDVKELCIAIEKSTKKSVSDRYIAKLFFHADSDNNGKISRNQFHKALEKFL